MNLSMHRNWQGQWQPLDGEEFYFFTGSDTYGPPKAHLPGFWTGSEGLAHPIRDRSGTKYVLKSFTQDCPERDQRMRWLCDKNLGHSIPVSLLRGAPYKYLGPPIQAQICPFVEGRTWSSLKDAEVSLNFDQRLWLAFSLAESARILEEGLTLCHSDLSPGNMLIDSLGTNGLPHLALIDFDAYFHKEVPVLPVGLGQTQGTPGYQAPESVQANRIIDSDRFSLAIHIHEFLAFGVDPDLGEPDHLFFEQEDLNAGKAEPTPRFKKVWGPGIDSLLRRALSAKKAQERPSPAEWCEAFRDLRPGLNLETSLLLTAEHSGQRQRFDLQSPTIDLSEGLKDKRVALRLTRKSHGYHVAALDKNCVAILHDAETNKDLRLDTTPREVKAGARVVVAGWELTFHAKK